MITSKNICPVKLNCLQSKLILFDKYTLTIVSSYMRPSILIMLFLSLLVVSCAATHNAANNGVNREIVEPVVPQKPKRPGGQQRDINTPPPSGIFGGGDDLAAANQYTSNPRFQWPPPRPSAYTLIPISELSLENETKTLGGLDKTLRILLERGQYFDIGYYSIPQQPDGFVMVTRLEKISEDGEPFPPSERWAVRVNEGRQFSIADYLSSLFKAENGYYRVIVFIISAHDFPGWSNDATIAEQAELWISQGNPAIDNRAANTALTDNHKVYALIYEFEKGCENCERTEGTNISQLIPGRLQSRQHLLKARIWNVK
ncbi:hypothetical protein QTP81_07360 [Alteromonas sp. ASW11-36]|uniref:Uncharacterized protein n=1 Tax=Alteromonas arenosi TaxID=3055817 RepID=A0ABT7SW62_9ALTE|nr:hypothetical protein [Alteromonas sp. ASW11-36]MDM7860409.1 hypothetical protein [Alteromonas sp. ASW11-36]